VSVPFFVFFAKMQFFQFVNTVMKTDRYSGFEFFLYNVIITASYMTFGIFNIDPSIIIGLCGASICFFNIYVFPLFMHLNDDSLNYKFDERKSTIVNKGE